MQILVLRGSNGSSSGTTNNLILLLVQVLALECCAVKGSSGNRPMYTG